MAAINAQKETSPAAALASCQRELADLKRELAMHDQLANRSTVSYDPCERAAGSEPSSRRRAGVLGAAGCVCGGRGGVGGVLRVWRWWWRGRGRVCGGGGGVYRGCKSCWAPL
eukprot:1961849-Prymnesium_polylepis.1